MTVPGEPGTTTRPHPRPEPPILGETAHRSSGLISPPPPISGPHSLLGQITTRSARSLSEIYSLSVVGRPGRERAVASSPVNLGAGAPAGCETRRPNRPAVVAPERLELRRSRPPVRSPRGPARGAGRSPATGSSCSPGTRPRSSSRTSRRSPRARVAVPVNGTSPSLELARELDSGRARPRRRVARVRRPRAPRVRADARPRCRCSSSIPATKASSRPNRCLR